FVEEFILDRTLTLAIETFGLAKTTLIDPTCGSGHFLLGGFRRLFEAWRAAEPGVSEREHAERALAAVTGVDLNPFAAAIARFRLLVAAVKASHIGRLADAPAFTIDVAVGDSLLWGARPGQLGGMETAATTADRQFLYRTEHAEALRRIFDRRYTAVVGNPPYIIARDKALNQQYRDRYPKACRGKYSLAAPFMQCFFELSVTDDGYGRPAGHVGMITTNAFMKRDFGKTLVEKLIPTWDVTYVVDTSGAYIPGHGTPTVIMLGRHQHPVKTTIRTVMGIRGEPAQPNNPAKGSVWLAIVTQIDEPGSESEFISVADTVREQFAVHPWSIGGGGASELKQRLDSEACATLRSKVESIGITCFTLEDEMFLVGPGAVRRADLVSVRPMVEGDVIRDYGIESGLLALFPYDSAYRPVFPSTPDLRHLWRGRTCLSNNKMFNGRTKVEEGLNWFEFGRLTSGKLRSPFTIGFAFVATHNHFSLDRGGKIFKQSAPVIKMYEGASEEDHLAVLALLNSGLACFWMHQVFHDKGNGGYGGGIASEEWERFYELDGTKLQQFPLPSGDPPLALVCELDSLASRNSEVQPSAIANRRVPTRASLDEARMESEVNLARMVSLQEELDWDCLHLYGLTDEALTVPEGLEPPPLNLGERAFEIILARKVAAGEVETAWFSRRRSTPITEIPEHWPERYRELVQRRIDLIGSDRDVALVERPEHKRRWAREPWEKLEERALREWLQDRLEDRRLWFEGSGDAERAVCRSVAQLADKVTALDPDFLEVARVWKGVDWVDPVDVVGELVADEHVPAQAAARYKGKGFDKRRQWQRTWDLQRMEDRGE
ncbi:MAG: BREX-2 system adenine-specific DNA-methyltransferase PglX, partial [Phycisphaerales bacterium]|nr:BREX-2 system adenine-specific DNA-methyltransferase PglX [Phycisphaerales bacterium]